MKKIKVKLFKCENINVRTYHNDYYDDVTKLVAKQFSDWEEVTTEEVFRLRNWVQRNPNHILVTHDEEDKLEQIAIKEQIEREENLIKIRKLEEEKYKETQRLKKEKAARRKIENAKKLLEKIEKEKAASLGN